MNREIKFRAWDSHEEKMYIQGNANDENRKVFWHEWENKIHISEPMQFTGLKDKNGIEIFESDIVRILYTDWMSKGENDNRTIEQYKNDISQVKIVQWSVNGFYVSSKIDGYMETMEHGKYGFIEVIGNIYQNPELLESVQK